MLHFCYQLLLCPFLPRQLRRLHRPLPDIDHGEVESRYINVNWAFPDGSCKLTDLLVDHNGYDTYLFHDYDSAGELQAAVKLPTHHRLGYLHWQTVRALGRWGPATAVTQQEDGLCDSMSYVLTDVSWHYGVG